MGKKKKQVTLSWFVQNFEAVQLASELQHKGFDVKGYLRDHIDGKPKDPKHYWGKTEGEHGKGKEKVG